MGDTCNMVVNWRCDANGEPGEEILCGAPVWLRSENGGGYCRKHADEAAADGLNSFTKADAAAYVAQTAPEKG